MSDFSPQDLSDVDSALIVWSAIASGGDTYINPPTTIVLFKNDGTGSIMVTVDTPFPDELNAIDNPSFNVPTGGLVAFNSRNAKLFSNHTGRVALSYTESGGGIAHTAIAVLRAADPPE